MNHLDMEKMPDQNTGIPIAGDSADVLVIYPPLHRLYGERKQWMPLSILYLASYLNAHGISARAYNADCSLIEPECVMNYTDRFLFAKNYINNLNSDNEIWREVREAIRQVQPKIIGISVLTEALGSAKKLIEMIRTLLHDVVIIAGGPHAEIDPEFLLRELHVDYVIKGDGEKSLYDLANALLNGQNPETVMGRCISGRTVHSVRVDVDKLPIPKLEYHYRYDLYRKVGRKLNISTSRGGCVYMCRFCYCSKYKYALRFRPPESVVDEIAYYLEHYQTRKLFFVDDTFTLNRKYVEDICCLMIRRELPVSWTCTTRAKQVDMELLQLMKRAGCKSIHIGAESGSPRILELIDKKIVVDDVVNVAELIRASGIECRLFLMAGLPTETPYDLRCTTELIRRIRPDETIMSMYVPIPGTPLYDFICSRYYPLDEIDWTTFSRDQLPYHAYIDDTDGTYDSALHDLYQLMEELNTQRE